MTTYQVRLINTDRDLDQTISVPEDEYIWDVADEAGIKLPAGCLQGECSVCVAKIIDGKVDQSEQKFFSPKELAQGYTVTCVGYPRSDCTLETHQEPKLYQNSLYHSDK
ncbi:2Fe-2S iron-sulfur cluster-binding protein [Pleurocapsa sp. PCC 7319]|uniref:2Fe-2S iron-sulfur cluster-binding protein n=1 Tax=Pleurocapsa sp. PCC 7319 TaxID=118161 RepID=UPI000345908F|nr:2Fe-2S iron-sulfur cluster-binding protein [Pleurocapsa sp. PCC 7319]